MLSIQHNNKTEKVKVKSIYIGNLAYNVTQQQVHDIFAQFGNVTSSRMIVDKTTRKFKGYAFVEMELENAKTAISMLNGTTYNGRVMRVSMANATTHTTQDN